MNTDTISVIIAVPPKKASEIVINATNEVDALNAFAGGLKWLIEKHTAKLSLCENTTEINHNLQYAIAMDTAGNSYNRVVATLKARKIALNNDMALSHFLCVIIAKCLPVKLAQKDIKSTKVVLDKETRFTYDKDRAVDSLLSFDVAIAEYQLTYGQLCSTSFVAGGVISLTLGNLHLVNKDVVSWSIEDGAWFNVTDNKPIVITIPQQVTSQIVIKIKVLSKVKTITLLEKDDVDCIRATKERKALLVSSKYHDFVIPSLSLLDILPPAKAMDTEQLPQANTTVELHDDVVSKSA